VSFFLTKFRISFRFKTKLLDVTSVSSLNDNNNNNNNINIIIVIIINNYAIYLTMNIKSLQFYFLVEPSIATSLMT